MAYINIKGGSYYYHEIMSVVYYKVTVVPTNCNTAFASFRLIRRRSK